MLDGVFVNAYLSPPFDKKEALRYAGCREADEAVERLLDECLRECDGAFSYRVCCRVFEKEEFLQSFGGESKALRKNLDGCAYAVAFAATVGLSIDRLIARYASASAAKALLLQAIGAERIEALCDAFCEDVRKRAAEKEFYPRPRFSPGYGDFSLEAQRGLFCALDCPRKLGLTLTDSLLMSPTKSVTAVVGLSKRPKECKTGCAACAETDCAYRSEGSKCRKEEKWDLGL